MSRVALLLVRVDIDLGTSDDSGRHWRCGRGEARRGSGMRRIVGDRVTIEMGRRGEGGRGRVHGRVTVTA